MKTVRLHITGRVQGVGYRVWATRITAELGVRGWVRNLADGAVEMLATGTDGAVGFLIAAARRGPPAARVCEIRVTDDEDDGSVGFTALPTL
jgi:acylphosphatase